MQALNSKGFQGPPSSFGNLPSLKDDRWKPALELDTRQLFCPWQPCFCGLTLSNLSKAFAHRVVSQWPVAAKRPGEGPKPKRSPLALDWPSWSLRRRKKCRGLAVSRSFLWVNFMQFMGLIGASPVRIVVKNIGPWFWSWSFPVNVFIGTYAGSLVLSSNPLLLRERALEAVKV